MVKWKELTMKSIIASEIEKDIRMQEFVERLISVVFDGFVLDLEGNEQNLEYFLEDMDISEEEMWTLFERLGYHKNNYWNRLAKTNFVLYN